jgi:hypothetical protein
VGESSPQKVFTRWSVAEAALGDGLLVIWPKLGLILTPLVNALGGDPGDGSLITSATAVTANDAAVDASYLLRATDPRWMQQFLDEGARAALAEAASSLPDRANSCW